MQFEKKFNNCKERGKYNFCEVCGCKENLPDDCPYYCCDLTIAENTEIIKVLLEIMEELKYIRKSLEAN